MTEPRPSVTRFVNSAARAEGANAVDERATSVAERILNQFYQRLGKLIGPAGFDALLGRSLVLAQRNRAALAGVTSAAGGKLEGLDALARDESNSDEAALTIVAHFVELLVTLIGEDLALGLLRDLWPTTANPKKP